MPVTEKLGNEVLILELEAVQELFSELHIIGDIILFYCSQRK